MNVRPFALVFGAAALVCGLAAPDEARAQSFSSQIRLPAGRAALVRTLLEGVSARRRLAAAEELGETGDPRVLEALATAAAHDTDPDVRRAARRAIRQIRGDQGGNWNGGWGFVPQPPPQDPNVTLVQSWYQRFLGRSADSGGLATFVGMLRRGVAATDVQAGILASDEFWRLQGGRTDLFIRGLYVAVLNREPSRDEVRGWERRFVALRGDRARLTQEFVTAAQQELLGNQNRNFFR